MVRIVIVSWSTNLDAILCKTLREFLSSDAEKTWESTRQGPPCFVEKSIGSNKANLRFCLCSPGQVYHQGCAGFPRQMSRFML